MTTRTAEAFLPYLVLSIYETPGSLRMTDGHPYGRWDVLRIWVTFDGRVAGRRGADPYGWDVLRIWVTFVGNVSGRRGADPYGLDLHRGWWDVAEGFGSFVKMQCPLSCHTFP